MLVLLVEDQLAGFEVLATVPVLTWHVDVDSSTFQSKVLTETPDLRKTFLWGARKQQTFC